MVTGSLKGRCYARLKGRTFTSIGDFVLSRLGPNERSSIRASTPLRSIGTNVRLTEFAIVQHLENVPVTHFDLPASRTKSGCAVGLSFTQPIRIPFINTGWLGAQGSLIKVTAWGSRNKIIPNTMPTRITTRLAMILATSSSSVRLFTLILQNPMFEDAVRYERASLICRPV